MEARVRDMKIPLFKPASDSKASTILECQLLETSVELKNIRSVCNSLGVLDLQPMTYLRISADAVLSSFLHSHV